MSSPYELFDFTQVKVQIQVAPITEASLRSHLASETETMRAALKERAYDDTRKAVVVVEFTGEYKPEPVARKIQAEWMKENRELLRLLTGATAFVVPNGVLRGALTAVLWLSPLPMPVSFHESMDLALDWAIGEVTRNAWGDVATELLMHGAMAVERRRVYGAQRASLFPGRRTA